MHEFLMAACWKLCATARVVFANTSPSGALEDAETILMTVQIHVEISQKQNSAARKSCRTPKSEPMTSQKDVFFAAD